MDRKIISKSKLVKCIAAVSILLSVVSLVFSVISGCFLVKLFRYLNTAQKAMPTMEKAAQLYLNKNSSDFAIDDYNDDDDDSISF